MNSGFVLALLFLLIISLYSFNNTNLLVQNAASVSHTHAVIGAIEKALSEMKDMETGQRGYIITGDKDYLAPYEAALASIDQTLERLKTLTSDNASQQAYIKQFYTLKDQKLLKMQKAIQLRKTAGFEAARQDIIANSGRSVMGEMREIADRMQSEEDRLLEIRNNNATESTRTAMSVIVGGGLISMLIILGALIVLNRAETERLIAAIKLEGQNRIRNALIELNERMGGDQNITGLAKNVIEKVSDFLNAKVGALYLADDTGMLKFVSGYAFQPPATAAEFKPGAGLVGQAAFQKTRLTVSDAPDTYFKVSSGLGEAKPKFIQVVPFLHDGQVKGVAEIGAFTPFTEEQIEFLNLSVDRIAVAFNSAQSRLRMAELLQETQAQAEELQAQQEELRTANEELGDKTRELEAQQEELRQSNEELEEQRSVLEEQSEVVAKASQYKSEFLANMSHELRTPLNSQLILSQILAENKEGNLTDKQREFAQTIHSTGLELLQLINDILDLSKVEAGKLDLDVRDFPLSDLMADVERTFKPTVEKKGLKFKLEMDSAIPVSVRSDSHRLLQVIKNFMSNSLKFTAKGEVRLHVGRPTQEELMRANIRDSNFLAFRVIDTGIGVPSEKMEKIFQAFEQVDSSISRQYGGTGLGLAICKKLADLLGGEVLASSEVGKGSVFTLLVPESLTAAATERREAPSSSAILIIDDNEALSAAFAELAKSQGYEVHVAMSGTEGLKYIEEQRPLGILLDSHLPDMRGLDILKKVKANAKTSHIPVFMVSGDNSGAEAEKHGALGFLMKPAGAKDVLQALEKIKLAAKGKRSRVLLVEDEKIHLEQMTRLLGSDRVEVTGAGSAEQAMGILESQDGFDCIVLDLHLSDMSGFDMLERLNQKQIRIPTIIHTAVDLDKNDEARLRKYSESIIVKGDRSGERLVDEVNLLLHRVQTGRVAKEGKSAGLFGAEAIFKGKHVLIADDDDRNIFALSNALQAKGLSVSTAHNGQEAIEALANNSFDLVLMDVMMPVMDGLEAMRRIRKKAKGSEIPIIALTAKAMKGSREACIEAGANDYLSKPVDMERLLALLRVWLAKK